MSELFWLTNERKGRAEREVGEPMRPLDLAIPRAPIEPSEAIQLSLTFDAAALLRRFAQGL